MKRQTEPSAKQGAKWKNRSPARPREVANSTEAPPKPGHYHEAVYKVVRTIPRGRVMTYGQIAEILGEHYTPRTVGFVMHGASTIVPWHRVVNSQGACSTARVLLPSDKQLKMLEAEGIQFDEKGRCDLGKHRWDPEAMLVPINR